MLVGSQRLVEGVAAVEGMLAQHALAPGVDGEHRRVVHRLGGHRQPPRGLGACGLVRVIGEQRGEQSVVAPGRGLAAKAARGFDQARADALGQLLGGRAGEGHHQNLGRKQRAVKGGRRGVCAGFVAGVAFARAPAVAEHQPQVERGDGPGLAGAGAGFDEAAAVEGKAQRLEGVAGLCTVRGVRGVRSGGAVGGVAGCRSGRHRGASSGPDGARSLCAVASTWVATHCASGPYRLCARVSKRPSALKLSKSG